MNRTLKVLALTGILVGSLGMIVLLGWCSRGRGLGVEIWPALGFAALTGSTAICLLTRMARLSKAVAFAFLLLQSCLNGACFFHAQQTTMGQSYNTGPEANLIGLEIAFLSIALSILSLVLAIPLMFVLVPRRSSPAADA